MKKKAYQTPQTAVAEIAPCQIIAASYPGDKTDLPFGNYDDGDQLTPDEDGWIMAE